MAWSTRTSQLVCLSYLVAVVWVLNEVTQPGAYVTDTNAGGFFSLFAPSPADAQTTTPLQPAADARPVALASAADLGDLRSRFVRPSALERPPEPVAPPATGERVVLLPTLPLPADERMLPALLAHSGDDASPVPVDPTQDPLPSSLRLAAAQTEASVDDARAVIEMDAVTEGGAAFAAYSRDPANLASPTDSEVVVNGDPLTAEHLTAEHLTAEHLTPEQLISEHLSSDRPTSDVLTPRVASAGLATAVAGAQAKPSPATPVGPKRYRVQKGDTLRSIAQRQLGRSDPATIRRIVAANPRLKRNPNRLHVGQELTLPAFGTPSAGANPSPVAVVAAG